MPTPTDQKYLKKPSEAPAIARPSSSVLLISPTNQILFLRRVRTSSSFASAHVFPGGALSSTHDGAIPAVDSPARHRDGPAYRLAAIRETFEECGILLAKDKGTGQFFTNISDGEREEGRKAVHGGKIRFGELLERWGAEPDVDALTPLTRWITPPNVPRRFSTQMYLYFLPLGSSSPTTHAAASKSATSAASSDGANEDLDTAPEIVIPNPTHDGGIEHTAARFLPPHKWISFARQNRIILFPPQFFLTLLLAPYLAPTITSPTSPIPSIAELQAERDALKEYLGTPREYQGVEEVSFREACISPVVLGQGQYGERGQDGIGKGVGRDTAVLALDYPGKEVEGSGRKGLRKWVVTTKFKSDGPRDVNVRSRADILGSGRVML